MEQGNSMNANDIRKALGKEPSDKPLTEDEVKQFMAMQQGGGEQQPQRKQNVLDAPRFDNEDDALKYADRLINLKAGDIVYFKDDTARIVMRSKFQMWDAAGRAVIMFFNGALLMSIGLPPTALFFDKPEFTDDAGGEGQGAGEKPAENA